MSFTQSIMSIFSGGASNNNQQAPQTPPTTEAQSQTPPAQSQETTTQASQAPQDPVAALDNFKDLWNPPKEGEGPETFDPSKLFQVDPEKIQQGVSQLNFTSAVTPELLARIQAGGDDAIKANLEIMNKVGQQAFMQSMLASSKLVEAALTKANSHLDSRIEQRTKQLQVSSSLRESNPALTHPAAAPLVSALEQQFAVKYPQATPAEITRLANEYLANFAQLASGKKEAPANSSNQEMDWEKFLTSN